MSTETDLEKARERVRVVEQLTLGAELLNDMLEQCSKDSNDREALKLAKRALLFALAQRLDEFIEFQAEIKRQDSN